MASSVSRVLDNRKTLVAIFIGLVVLVAALFFTLFEYVEKEVDAGLSKEAMRDPWLGASLFLRKKGYALVVDERLERLDDLSELSTLIISRDDFLLTQESFNRVMAWVSQGGNLIIGFEDESGFLARALYLSDEYIGASEIEPLLTEAERAHEANAESVNSPEADEIEVVRAENKAQDASDHTDGDASEAKGCPPERIMENGRCRLQKLSEQMRAENAAAKAAFEARKFEDRETHAAMTVPPEHAWAQDYVNSNRNTRTYVHFTGDPFNTYVDWDTYRSINYTPPDADEYNAEDDDSRAALREGLNVPPLELVARVGNDALTHFMQFEAGAGTISVLVHTRIWQNDAIGRLDHAYLLWSLAGPVNQPIALLHGRRMPSLFSLIMKYLPEFVVAGLCLMLAHFLRRAWRFGPRIVATYGVRRSLLEHVVASGVFLWEQGAQGALLDPLRRSVQHLLMLRMGQGFDASTEKDWARIYPELLPKLNTSDQKVLREALMRVPVPQAKPLKAGGERENALQPLSAADFYKQVRLLQTLRKVL